MTHRRIGAPKELSRKEREAEERENGIGAAGDEDERRVRPLSRGQVRVGGRPPLAARVERVRAGPRAGRVRVAEGDVVDGSRGVCRGGGEHDRQGGGQHCPQDPGKPSAHGCPSSMSPVSGRLVGEVTDGYCETTVGDILITAE